MASVEIQRFRNFVEPQTCSVEDDVTCLIGKNESGKTTILKALHRLNPANGASHSFDLSIEYPRALLAEERKKNNLSSCEPISATFVLTDAECRELGPNFAVRPPLGSTLVASRNYADELFVEIYCELPIIVRAAGADASAQDEDIERVAAATTLKEGVSDAARLSDELTEKGETARSDAAKSLSQRLKEYAFLIDEHITDEQQAILQAVVPRFFYFSEYDILPGSMDLEQLARKVEAKQALDNKEVAVVALLSYANEEPGDFLDENYDSRKAELQAAASSLTRKVFKYWRQNPDLKVVLDTDMPVVGQDDQGRAVRHRTLKIELADDRHGGVETNFNTRSSGFQWFFSFLAAFSQYQDSNETVVVLLDEPATSLHGEAQRDFVRFIYDELGASQQVLYTTHSQHMVDPTQYEKIRAVTDTATRENPENGVIVRPVTLSADRETLLPVEAALGYSVSQHLFLGSGQHLAVEGSSDFIYIHQMSEYLASLNRVSLDPRLSIIPVGSADNMPAFVALLGRRLKVTALLDGAQVSKTRSRTIAAAAANGVPESHIVTCSQVAGLPATADIEDLFSASDYIRLYSWAIGPLDVQDLPQTGEPVLKKIEQVKEKFDHAQPAHALTRRSEEFFHSVQPESIDRFEELFRLLNSTVDPVGA